MFTNEPVEPAVLADSVSALAAVEVDAAQPLPLAIAPHEGLMLSVQFGRDPREPDAKAALGRNTCLTGIRQWTGSFVGAGNCVSLFALLTPLGAVRLLDSRPLQHAPRIRARVDELLDEKLTRQLEDAIVRADDTPARRARWPAGSKRAPRCRGARTAARCAPRAPRWRFARGPPRRSIASPMRSMSRGASSNATWRAGSAPRRAT